MNLYNRQIFYTINLKAGKFDIILVGVLAGLQKSNCLHKKTLYQWLLIQEALYLKRATVPIVKLFKNSITAWLLKHQSLFPSRWFKFVPKLHSSSVSWVMLSDVLIHWKHKHNYVHHNQLFWCKNSVRIIWKHSWPCTIVTSTHLNTNAYDLYSQDPLSATSYTHEPIH